MWCVSDSCEKTEGGCEQQWHRHRYSVTRRLTLMVSGHGRSFLIMVCSNSSNTPAGQHWPLCSRRQGEDGAPFLFLQWQRKHRWDVNTTMYICNNFIYCIHLTCRAALYQQQHIYCMYDTYSYIPKMSFFDFFDDKCNCCWATAPIPISETAWGTPPCTWVSVLIL